jgi:hypothetical protein
LLLSKTTKLKVENLAQTTFRFSLLGFLPIDIAIPFRNGKERERERTIKRGNTLTPTLSFDSKC